MNPAFLDNLSWEMAEVYGAITDQILINLSRYFRYYKPGDKIPRTAFEYQAQMLAQMGKVNRDTIRIIRNGLGDADEALKNTLEQAIIDSVSKSQPELLKGVKAGILAPQGVPIVAPNQMRAFELYYKQSADRLNLVNTVMLESTKSAYQQTIADVVSEIMLSDRVAATYEALDVATGEVVAGVSSWNTALRHATNRLKNRGITGFVDHAGRQWSAESYVAMDIRTTAFNTGRAAVWEQNQNFGNDLYLVSYHNGARPGCYDWQNKVISSLNISRDVADLDGNTVHVYAQSDTTYGQPAGLFGINCKHYPSPFIPGVSLIRGEPQSPEENEKTYRESQEQRRLERKLREEKRDLLIAKEQGASPEELAKLREKARNTSQDIDDFCDQTGRARHRDREAVYTKREFPDKEKYDVSEFEHKQQEEINKYFKDGGAQREFSAGQMTPNSPDVYTVKDAVVTQESYRHINPGTASEIVLDKADVYTMPDGMQFVFKSGMVKAQQQLTPEQLIGKYYEVPKGLRDKGQKVINVIDRYNPSDTYWRKEYKKLGFKFDHSYMTGGKEITVYRYDRSHDINYLGFSIDHEIGHNIDGAQHIISGSQEWADAIAKDKALSGKDSWREYGATRKPEDFADSIGFYTTEHDEFVKTFPNRTTIIERIIRGDSP